MRQRRFHEWVKRSFVENNVLIININICVFFITSHQGQHLNIHKLFKYKVIFFILCRNFCLSKIQYIYMTLNREPIYCNMYHLYVSKYSYSLLKNAFSSDTILWEILHVCAARSTFSSNFVVRTRTDNFSAVFPWRFMYLVNVYRKRTLGVENEVGSLAVESRETTDN